MNFLKTFLAALLALVIFSIIGIFIFFGWIGAMTAEKPVDVKENSVLHLKLDATFTELQKENPFEGLPIAGEEASIGIIHLKQAIRKAKEDDRIKGIFLEVSFPAAGFSTLKEIRESLEDFKQSGKWIFSYNTFMSENAYYLASVADQVYVNPQADIEFNGLTITISFFKKLFDKLEIHPQIFRVGEFKSAVEPFLLEQMSKENELQLNELANSLYNNTLKDISESRNIPVEKLEEISDNMLVRNAQSAKELGLVDDLLYEDQVLAGIRTKLGLEEDKKIDFITYENFRKSYSTYKSSSNEIAVIVAEGTIMPGDSDSEDVIAADRYVKEIRKARMNDAVKAIVLRINSPGGEFRASDMIWREIQLAKKEKPVIASMSDYAASGGYYIAMGCDTIIAQPQTITGSIGIFGIMFDMSDFLGNKLGITFDEVRTGQFGEMFTVTRPLTEAEKAYWQRTLEENYATFVEKAAEGRDVQVDQILPIAGGRVWSGAQAEDRKLVDIEGGFDDAIRITAEKANLGDDYKVRFYPEPMNFFERWLAQQSGDASMKQINDIPEIGKLLQQVNRIKTYQGSQARIPFEFSFH